MCVLFYFVASRRRHTRCALVTGVQTCALPISTKPDAPPAELQTLTLAKRELGAVICAIGGITPDNGAQVIAAGADLIAAVDGVFGSAHIEAAARAYAALWSGTTTRKIGRAHV